MPMWCATVLTIFPEMFPGPLGLSVAGRALESGLWSLEPIDIRAFATDRVLRFLDEAGVMKRPARNNPNKAQPKKKAQERAAAAAAAPVGAAAPAPAPAAPAPATEAPAGEAAAS